MAKFFLFVFTILLSLSLGLFVGQNYILNGNSKSDVAVQDQSPRVSLMDEITNTLHMIKDKIFANDQIVPIEKEEFEEQQFADLSNTRLDDTQTQTEVEVVDENTDETPESETEVAKVETTEPTQKADVKKSTDATSTKTEKIEKKPIVKTESIAIKADVQTDVSAEWTESQNIGWAIQVAAFQDIKDAQKAEQQVKDAGFPNYTYKTKINGQTWYRINVGPFDSIADATNFKQSKKVHVKFKGAFVRKL